MSSNNTGQTNRHFPLEDANMLLESLFSHTRPRIIDSLRKHRIDLPLLPSKRNLRAHTEKQLEAGIIDINRIAAALLEVEGWGRQQVYLYRWAGGNSLLEQWRDLQWVNDRFRESEMSHVFNNTQPLTAQSDSTLYSIEYPRNGNTIRFVWTQYRTNVTRTSDKDPQPPDPERSPDGSVWQRTILRAYSEKSVRDITSFEWNIDTGEAMLMIRKSKDTNYVAVRDSIKAKLADILPIEDFSRVSVSKVIDNLDEIEDVIIPRVDYRPLNDPNFRMTFAGGAADDVLSNPKMKEIRAEHRDDFNGYGGFSKWKVGKKKWVGIDLYAKKDDDHRIGIRSEQLEKDVRHALRRIRAHC